MGTKRILITNAIPTNNGDAALVLGLYNRLLKDGFRVQVATFDQKRISKLYKNIPIVEDILDHSILRSSPIIKKLQFLILPFIFFFSEPYRKADLIIGVPGGYLNSFYMFSHKLFVYKIAKFFGKKTAIYSQSVGPFDKRGENIMKRYIPYLDTLLVRDAFSHDLTKNIFTYEQMKKVIKTEDAAFLLDYSKRESPKTKKIAVSVRSWNKDGRDSEAYRVLVKSFCVFVLEKGYKIDFLSTCQGLPNYVDDSIEAREIISSIPPQHSNNIVLDDHWYDVNELQRKLREYSFVIGTRLHMCILSLLNDVPAFNISYEIKGLECYTYLKMEKYSVDYNEDVSTALKKLKDFVENKNVISDHISDQIPIMHLQAEKHYATFLKKLEIHSALREANPKVNM